MPEHFNKATVQAKFWCAKCNGPTMHYVSDGRRGGCHVCIKRGEDSANAPKPKPAAEQMSLMDVYGTVDIG